MLIIGPEIALLWSLVPLRRKPPQSIIEDIYPQRIDAANQHIYSKIELVALNEQWVGHVPLHHAMLPYLNL